MADLLDVQNALAILAESAIYPNGTTSPSITNCDVRIYPGWPIPDTLDQDLAARKAHVNIFPTNIARVTTRFDTEWYTTNTATPTLALTINLIAGTITVSGAVSLQQSCMAIVNGTAYSYGVLQGDTLNSIATNLAALIPNASAVGAVITITGVHSLSASVIYSGTSVREVARETRMMYVNIWAPTPQIRSTLSNAINSLFAATYRVALPDGFYGQLKYSGSNEIDMIEKVQCYRRDIHFTFEYAITQSETDYTIGDNIINVTPYNTLTSPLT